MRLSRAGMILSAALALAATACADGSGAPRSETPFSVAGRMMEAHGGAAPWRALKTISIDREHEYADGTRFEFHIDAEYGTERNYQRWTKPAGEIVWDGERAWSANWPRALAAAFISILC